MEEHQKAFETLKGALLCRPVLVLPRKDRHWRLATDASIVAMGAVLSQYDDDNIEHPIGYYSRNLIDALVDLGAGVGCGRVGIYALQTVPS